MKKSFRILFLLSLCVFTHLQVLSQISQQSKASYYYNENGYRIQRKIVVFDEQYLLIKDSTSKNEIENLIVENIVSDSTITNNLNQPNSNISSISNSSVLISEEFRIYPNPTFDNINVQCLDCVDPHFEYSYSVYSEDIKHLFTLRSKSNNIRINMEFLPTGVYYLLINNSNKINKRYKIIKY